VGSRPLKVAGSERIGGNYTTLHNTLQSRNAKRWEPTKIGLELILKGVGSGKIKPPCPPTPVRLKLTKIVHVIKKMNIYEISVKTVKHITWEQDEKVHGWG